MDQITIVLLNEPKLWGGGGGGGPLGVEALLQANAFGETAASESSASGLTRIMRLETRQ